MREKSTKEREGGREGGVGGLDMGERGRGEGKGKTN